ncbi:ThiF family adenylyltransferase [Archangium gephyra]|uniref:ThiF family adenylyltransferase n=1 Tax=Archangium gephyra TaxID=48 RepID=UPI0035D51D81
MSQRLISRSPDLRRLRDEGYEIEIRGNHLVIKNVPYVNARREVLRGTLISELSLAGDVTIPPATHVAMFSGEEPCNQDGRAITQITHSSSVAQIDRELFAQRSFSAKPTSGRYEDYYDKMTTYVAILSGPAQVIDPQATAKTFPVIAEAAEDSVFHYMDTASSRAGIGVATQKLELGKVAIVGLGGTGSYVLDQVAKTPVKEIHLFDGDKFSQHNAFRSPGAPSTDELKAQPLKVNYLHGVYSKMHRHIIPHGYYVDLSNVEELRGMNFVFLCLDRGESKRALVEKLEEFGVPFVDVGMGLYLAKGSVYGVLRVTTSTPEMRDHVRQKNRIPFSDGGDDPYSSNIQVADLNALNASLAVVRWKKLFGFYGDLEREHFATYTLDGNTLVNEDRPGPA